MQRSPSVPRRTAAIMVRRRFRHLLVVLLAWIVQAIMIQILLAPMLRRPRPFGVEFRTDWTAWALPSEQMAALVVVLVGILYGLVPEGRWRQIGKWVATGLVALVTRYRCGDPWIIEAAAHMRG